MGQRMPIFMEDVPDYECHGEHMHIIWRELEIVLPVHVMLAGMASAEEAIAKWQLVVLANDDNIIHFPPR